MKSISVAEFLAHAVALEEEAAHRYDEMAQTMEVHNNREVANLFRQMGDFARRHWTEALKRADGHALPRLKSWEYRWPTTDGSPEAAAFTEIHYLMTPHHAMKLALATEREGWAYYDDLATDAKDPVVRAMAAEFAAEEAEHVATLEAWVEKHPPAAEDWNEDHDPPICVD